MLIKRSGFAVPAAAVLWMREAVSFRCLCRLPQLRSASEGYRGASNIPRELGFNQIAADNPRILSSRGLAVQFFNKDRFSSAQDCGTRILHKCQDNLKKRQRRETGTITALLSKYTGNPAIFSHPAARQLQHFNL